MLLLSTFIMAYPLNLQMKLWLGLWVSAWLQLHHVLPFWGVISWRTYCHGVLHCLLIGCCLTLSSSPHWRNQNITMLSIWHGHSPFALILLKLNYDWVTVIWLPNFSIRFCFTNVHSVDVDNTKTWENRTSEPNQTNFWKYDPISKSWRPSYRFLLFLLTVAPLIDNIFLKFEKRIPTMDGSVVFLEIYVPKKGEKIAILVCMTIFCKIMGKGTCTNFV